MTSISLLKYYQDGPESVAKEVGHFISEPIVLEALEIIKEKFSDARAEGCFQASYFLQPRDVRARSRTQVDVYATIAKFLDELKV